MGVFMVTGTCLPAGRLKVQKVLNHHGFPLRESAEIDAEHPSLRQVSYDLGGYYELVCVQSVDIPDGDTVPTIDDANASVEVFITYNLTTYSTRVWWSSEKSEASWANFYEVDGDPTEDEAEALKKFNRLDKSLFTKRTGYKITEAKALSAIGKIAAFAASLRR